MSDESEATREAWQALYQAAARFKAAAPWTWMYEDQIFGIENPETGELGFASIMGQGGEHLALGLYLGTEGLYGYWALQDAGQFMDIAPPELLLETPQLQASWEDRNDLTDRDRKQIKTLGLKFRGRQSWPRFRSFRPGYVPWYLTADEVAFLTWALEQALDVAQRAREDDSLLDPPDTAGEDEAWFLFRVRGEDGAWRDEWREVPDPGEQMIEFGFNPPTLAHLRQQRAGKSQIEADLMWLPSGVQEQRGERPFYAYILMLVESRRGMIAGVEMLHPDPTLLDMWSDVPGYTLELLAQLPEKPQSVTVSSERLASYLRPLLEEAGIRLKLAHSLPALEAAQVAVMGLMGMDLPDLEL